MDMTNQVAEIARTWPEELKKKKDKGIKIIGYDGRFIPEELIYASGAVPFFLCRGGEPEPPDAVLPYMLRFLSPFARAQMGYYLLGVDPIIPMLDLIVAQCSDCHMARLADLFEYFQLPTIRLGIPSDWKKSLSQNYYHRGLSRLKKSLEDITGNEISDQKLKESIKSMNKVRDLLMKINILRKQQPPPIGGYDFIRINHRSFFCDPEETIKMLNDLYRKLKNNGSPFPAEVTRILLAGNRIAVGDYVVLKLIEESGGAIVAEFLDEGIRQYAWGVKTAGDIMINLTETYYLDRTPPSIFQPAWAERIEYMKKLIKEFKIDGVIWYQLSFEEIYDMECSVIIKSMDEMKIPILKLESSYEYSREAMGPLATRIESFIRSIEQRR